MMTQTRKSNRIATGTRFATGTRIFAVLCASAVLSTGAVSGAAPVDANNQDGTVERRPPRPKPAAKAPIVTSTLLGALLSGIVIFAGLMPVKRSHQD